MNKAITPKQLELNAGKISEELILGTASHINPTSPALEVDKVEAARAALATDEEDFDWDTDDTVILKEQRPTAVYYNKMGELIIRQRATWDDEHDTFIYIAPENVTALLEGAAKKARG